MNKNKQESGQVLVLIILAAVVIFGFAALAVDVGRLYSERRRAQSAADAAAYAAAYAATQGETKPAYLDKGLKSAKNNGFTDTDVDVNIDQLLDVQVHNPPISGKYSVASETINPSEYFQVIIRTEVPKVFSQFVYAGPWIVQVESVVHSTGETAFARGNAIVAVCKHCCNALTFSGSGTTIVTDGSILSNSTGDPTKTKCFSGQVDSNATTLVVDGDINLGGAWNDKTGDNTANQNLKDVWPEKYPGMPGCVNADGTKLPTVAGGTYKVDKVRGRPGPPITLQKGIYTGGIKVNDPDTTVLLEPGMYCLDGDLSITAGTVIGDGVMFVMRGSTSINIQGSGGTNSANVRLTAPGYVEQCIKDPTVSASHCWSGFLFYMPVENVVGQIKIVGSNSTEFEGTMYAPGGPTNNDKKCMIQGASETTGIKGSIICYDVDVSGNGNLNITYEDKINAQDPAMMELAK